MSTWVSSSLLFIVGCVVLAWSATRFITSSSALAKNFNMSSLMVGILLVGFGTSFPEMIVSATAAFHGQPGLAIGNALGSNIMNIGLVIGLIALIIPLKVHSRLLKREYPIMFLVSIFVGILISNRELTRLDGLILLIFLAIHIYWMFWVFPKWDRKSDVVTQEYKSEIEHVTMSTLKASVWWFVGLFLMVGASEVIVQSAVSIAKLLHVSDLIIGLTIVALGTSLPELAASAVGAMRGDHDIAIGNVVGSNIFNLLGVLMLPALIAPTKLPASFLYRDYPIMIFFMLLLWILFYFPKPRAVVGRFAGCVLLLVLVLYIILLLTTNPL